MVQIVSTDVSKMEPRDRELTTGLSDRVIFISETTFEGGIMKILLILRAIQIWLL